MENLDEFFNNVNEVKIVHCLQNNSFSVTELLLFFIYLFIYL